MLFYEAQRPSGGLQSPQAKLLLEAIRANNELLQKQGRLLAGAMLQTDAVTTLDLHQGELTLVVGPVTVTGVQLSAFYLLDAYDLNDAIQVTAQMPQAQLGWIEIHPIAEEKSLAA